MFLRLLGALYFITAVCCVQQVKVVDDNRVSSSRIYLRCNESQTTGKELVSYCILKSTRCILRENKIAAKDEIFHPKEAHYIACLMFDKSSFTIIPKDFFTSYPVVKYIDLSFSNVFKIADFAFEIPSLLELNLRGNTLISLSASVFDGAQNLRVIDLSHNNIKSIEPETFMNLRSLSELDLSYNEIHNNTFNRNGADWIEPIVSLKVLDLSFNKISYYDNMPYQTFSGLSSLESLNLRSNDLNIDFGVFSSNHNLKTLDFSYNNLTYFDINFLMSVASLENLVLHGNNIAYASQVKLDDIRTVFPEIKTLGLSENQFSCEVLSIVIKKMLKANIKLVVDEGKFVNDKRNLRGVACF